MTAGAARIRVSFAVDADGLLTVSAEERTTGVAQRIEVKPSYGLSHEDMADMLYDSLENAEADMTARLLTEARVEARRSLLALDAALAKDGSLLAAEERAALDAGRARLEGAMAGDSRDDARNDKGDYAWRVGVEAREAHALFVRLHGAQNLTEPRPARRPDDGDSAPKGEPAYRPERLWPRHAGLIEPK